MDTPITVDGFKELMSGLVAGVAVVTARTAAGTPCGLVISSLCSYSAAPPSVLAAIGRAARSYPALVDAESFGVHLLDDDHRALADVFASRRDDKFDAVAWHWRGTVPRLDAVRGFMLCRTRTVIPDGDHAVLIGDVVTAEYAVNGSRGHPLIYYRRRVGSWHEHAPAGDRPTVAPQWSAVSRPRSS